MGWHPSGEFEFSGYISVNFYHDKRNEISFDQAGNSNYSSSSLLSKNG